MSPALNSHLQIMPRLSEEILFPTPRGAYMRRSSWSAHWHSIRASALMPGLEFYELRHRALQWMIDPPDNGGLGLDIQTAARMAGHSDGGYLVCSTYTKLSEHQAHTRAQSAMDTYQQHLESLPKRVEKATVVGV
jgi:integrase